MEYTKNTMLDALKVAHASTTNRHSKIAYAFATSIIETLQDTVLFNVRATQNALNLGDIIECATRYHITNDIIQGYAKQGHHDIENALRHEVKTFSNSNRYPNATMQPVGFIAISKYGVYYITKKLASKYWNDDRMHLDSKGGKQWTLSILQDMIMNDSPRMLKDLTKKMLGLEDIDNDNE